MFIYRIILGIFPAAIITMLLFFLMHFMIEMNMTEPKDVVDINIPDVLMPERKITTEYDTSKPEKPQEVDSPPPELPKPNFDNLDVTSDISFKAPTVKANVEFGTLNTFSSDGDYLPIVKVSAKYPFRALNRGVEGYCVVQYTVTTTGQTRDIRVVDCPQEIFADVSVKAAEKFKYKPKVVDGEAIEVPGVRNRFLFEVAQAH